MPKLPPTVKIQCTNCKNEFSWTLEGFALNIVGVIQAKCLNCAEIITFPRKDVWGLRMEPSESDSLINRLFEESKEEKDN